MNCDRAPILVAACGNPTAGDDAFGPLLAESLRRSPLRDVEVADLGMNPGGLLDLLDGRWALVIADAAVVAGAAPGTLIDCDWGSIGRPVLAHECVASTHGFSVADEVQLARNLGLLPEVVRLIAVTIDRETGSQPGPPCDAVVRQLAPARERIARLAGNTVAHSITEKWYV